jgi:hypothetical protein
MKWTEFISGGEPMLAVKLDEVKLGRSAAEVSQRLQDGAPAIYVRESRLRQGILVIYAGNLNEERTKIVEQRLYTEITKK